MLTDSSTHTRPLGLLDDVELTDQQLEILQEIDRYEIPFVEERMLSKKLIQPEQVSDAVFEFKRFMGLLYLNSGTPGSLAVASPVVDEVWHQFILFTRQYAEFCEKVVGRFLHHRPRTTFTPTDPQGAVRFREQYQKWYGEIPPIWLSAADCDESTASTGDSEWFSGDDD